ncbi:hypothetical protein F4861DRAFT_123690 [Xylaria intraflava]|nr:hypothetical protein F4861DRAFT_123690 [Xylaria intraflava]
MDVANPRRILAVSSADSVPHLIRVLRDLTGTAPEQTSTSLAGASHSLSIKNTYYTAEVPIWLDLISSPSEWSASFLSPEAKEVLQVLGAVIVVFALPVHAHSEEGKAAQDLIKQVGKVTKDGLGGWDWDGVSLCLGVGEIDDVNVWEDCCSEVGLEFVQVRNQSTPSRNEFGEKTGIPRVLEALESNDWEYTPDYDLGSDFEDIDAEMDARERAREGDKLNKDTESDDLDPKDLDFGFDPQDFEGLRRAIWNVGQEDEEESINGEPSAARGDQTSEEREESLDDSDIQKVERMMAKLQAVRETNAGLPEDQRKRAAAKAVAEVMRDL